MKRILIATMILIGLLASTQAHAAPICEYFDDIGYVYISGSAGSGYANKTMNFMLKENGNDSPDDDSILYIGDFKTDENGNYVYKFKINLAGEAQDYYIHSRIYGQQDEQTPLVQGEWLTAGTPVYDRINNEIHISGSYKYESDDKDLTIKIKRGTLLEITDWDADILYQAFVPVNEDNGLFSIGINLIEHNLTPGFYSLKLYDDISGCEFMAEFEIYDVASVLDNINTYIENQDASGLLNYINGKTDILGIDTWQITSGVGMDDLTADVYTLLINNDDNIADIGELQLEIKRAYATDCLNQLSSNDYEAAKNILFTAFDDIFDIEQFSYYTQYEELAAQGKEEDLLDALLEKEGGLTSFSDAQNTLSNVTLITAINETEFWNQIQDIVSENELYFTLENIPAQTWKDVWDFLPFDDISTFEEKCNELKEIPAPVVTPRPSGSVSSGGGGGGGGVSPVVGRPTTVTDEKAPENFATQENPAVSNTDNNKTFIDVPDNHWASNAITYLSQKGIVNGFGDNSFLPDKTLTREELIKMLVVATGNTPAVAENSFRDVDVTQWYAGYITTAKALGITNGKGDGNFGVGEPLTREDAAVLCYRALGQQTDATANELAFTDNEMISDYAKEAVAKMVNLGIINGKGDGTFAPKDYCTRAEIAKILYGVLKGDSK